MSRWKNRFKNEKQFEREVRRLLRTREDLVLLPKIESSQEPGWPDVIFALWGSFYAIELKMPGKKLRKTQERKIEELRKKGFSVFVLYPADYTLDNMVKILSLGGTE